MFASPYLSSFAASPFARSANQAQAYRQMGVEIGVAGASPHKLVALLFDGLMDAIAQARGAMRAGQVELKCKALMRAVRIVDEGLKASLDLDAGGQIASDLKALYDFAAMSLTRANLHNDEKSLDECVRVVSPLRDAWTAIGPQVEAANR